MYSFLIIAAAASAASPTDDVAGTAAPGDEIVVTAALEPVALADTPVSASLFDAEQIRALAFPDTSDLLRLVPGVSVATSGPRGSQTQVRIRGAEANHTLLFVDGIRFNDPAAGNEARFELLGNDLLSRVEVVRGPQSALWGSEALGGVIAVETRDGRQSTGLSGIGEYGSLDSARAAASLAERIGRVGVSSGAGWMRSDGIDAFGRNGERDGFWNRNATMKAVFDPGGGEIGIVGHYVEGRSAFDGYDPVTFQRTETLDATRNRILAMRGWSKLGVGGWSGFIESSYLSSANHNELGDQPLNSTFGKRITASGQLSRTFGGQRLTVAAEHQDEEFRATDQNYFGGTDQKRSRSLDALIGEWSAQWSRDLASDIAVRRDSFSAFADTTTIRAALLFRPVHGLTVHAGYGEGIAQPTFYDLYGFFPGSFRGNPSLRPERSAGFEAGIGWEDGGRGLKATAFSNRLKDEIVDTFDPATFLSSTANADGQSRRHGIEVEAHHRLAGFDLALNYTYLDAREQQVAGTQLVREVRRPRHSANLIMTGRVGPVDVGASLAYVGSRRDTDFDVLPARAVTLHDYLLGSLNFGWRLTGHVEAYLRSENLFGAHYQDAVGYRTAGRTIYAGIRLRPSA